MAPVPRIGGEERQRQDVRRRRHRAAEADRVPALVVEAPPVAGAVGDRRQRTAADRAERVAGADHERDGGDGERDRDRIGEEAGDQPGVLEVLVVVGLVAGDRRRRVALGRCRAAPLGDVGGLVGGRGGQVADEVEPVPVGQPPGRQQPLDAGVVDRRGLPLAALPARLEQRSRAGRRRRPVRRARRAPRRPIGRRRSRASAASSRAPAGPPGTAAPPPRQFASRVKSAARRSW